MLTASLIALDSSHWAGWIEDARSRDSELRSRANGFAEALLRRGLIPVVTIHHMAELLSVSDEAQAMERVDFIRGLPCIAWLKIDQADGLPEGVVSLAASECRAACEGAGTLEDVRRCVRAGAFRFGSGQDGLGESWVWRELRPHMVAQAESARRVAAIAPVDFGNEHQTVGDLVTGRFRAQSEAKAALSGIQAMLAGEISSRGDRRIEKPGEMASDFIAEVASRGPLGASSVEAFVYDTYARLGVARDEIRPEMTLSELGDLVIFRSKLKVLAEVVGRTAEDLWANVRQDQLPHWILGEAIRKYRHPSKRRSGSELNDNHLAMLAPYVDYLYVDRNTADAFRRMADAGHESTNWIGRVARATDYNSILGQLDQADSRA